MSFLDELEAEELESPPLARRPKDIEAYGTSEGVKKEWDERGRGRHDMELIKTITIPATSKKVKLFRVAHGGNIDTHKFSEATRDDFLTVAFLPDSNEMVFPNLGRSYGVAHADFIPEVLPNLDNPYLNVVRGIISPSSHEATWYDERSQVDAISGGDPIRERTTSNTMERNLDLAQAFKFTIDGKKPKIDVKDIEEGQMAAAAELPDIVGFDKDEAQEIREYLIKFPRKLLHHTERVEANPDLGALHGKCLPDIKTVQINPANFTSKMKFGTHDPADIDEHVLAHELCHALYTSLSGDEQKRWMALSGWMKGTKKGQALPYVEIRPGWPHEVSSWTHSPDAKFARRYQKKSPSEDFADSCAYYCTGNGDDLPKEKKDFIATLL